jgi:hypothetical protein
LKACLDAGMQEDMVMTEEEKKDKKKRAGKAETNFNPREFSFKP